MRAIRKLARHIAYAWFGMAAVLVAPGLATAAPITPTFDQRLDSMPENSWLKVSTNQFNASIWPDDSLLPYPNRAGGHPQGVERPSLRLQSGEVDPVGWLTRQLRGQ